MTMKRSYTVPETEHSSRLDAFIARAENCGVRAAKRRIADGAVTVDGRVRPAHFKLQNGSVVAICRDATPSFPDMVALAGICGEYLAFVKPAGLHTARVAGSAEPSLEHTLALDWGRLKQAPLPPRDAVIPDFLRTVLDIPQNKAARAALPQDAPKLLSRLDAMTSGLVLAASSNDAAAMFRTMEAMGRIDKYYLTVIDGILEETVTVTNALDTANRARTRVLPYADPDITRHTGIYPLGDAASFSIPETGSETTLAMVRIKRGARHQIRAHLAYLGFPLLGDALYGRAQEEAFFRLHHARLATPGFSFFCLPSWWP